MIKKSCKILFKLSTMVLLTIISAPSLANEISFKFKKSDIAENLSFSGSEDWDYRIEKLSNNKIKLIFPNMISEQAKQKLKKLKGNYIRSIQVTKNELTSSEVILSLRSDISYFDYLTDQPSNLVIDFYQDKTKAAKVKAKNKSKKAKADKDYSFRKPASTEFISFDQIGKDINKVIIGDDSNSLIRRGVFDSADPNYDRFKISKKDFDYRIIEKNLQKNAFLRFPILYRKSSQLSSLLDQLPLHVIKSKDKKETKEAQLIHTLYKSKTWAAFHKMYEYFNKTYPNSKYKNLLRSLATSSYFQLWKQTNKDKYLKLSQSEFLKFKKEKPDSRATEFWDKIMFYTNLEQKQGLEAARLGEAILKKYPEAADLDYVKLNLADAYLQASQYREASRVYKNLIQSSNIDKVKRLASFTLPLVYLKQYKVKKAVANYITAKKVNQKHSNPSYYFNMGEAYFWKGDYYRSSQLFLKFIKNYPKHMMNSFAITRIGEIMSLVGYDEKKYKPLFLESVYRFKGQKGADIAEMRINSLKINNRRKVESEHYISEINKIAGKYKDLGMTYFKEITIADALSRNDRFLESNKYLETAYKRNPYSRVSSQIKPRILLNLEKEMKSYLSQNEYLKSIELYEKNRGTWLSSIKEPEFKKIVARGFELAGMNNYALAHYVDFVNKKTEMNEPVDNQVILSMATLYQKNKDYDNMDKYLKILSDTSGLSEAEKFKAVKLKFDVYEEKAIYDRAEKLLKAFIKPGFKNKEIKAETVFLMSDFYADRGKFDKALSELKVLESEYGEQSQFYYPLSKRLIKMQVRNGNDADAINKIRNIEKLEQFKNDEPFIFYAGNLLMNNNEQEQAEQVWSLINNPNSLYTKLIDEKRKHNAWEKNYGKYINRIPAMSK